MCGSLAFALALLGGCASPPRAVPTGLAGGTLSGRLLIRAEAAGSAPAQTLSASFELQGDERQGSLALMSPLGTRLADARWAPDGVVLLTPDGERRFDDLPSLARETLGEDVPLGALTHWLAGRPWPGAASQPTAQGFDQLDWSIDLSRLASDAQVEARRVSPPAVLVRARLDR
jgi:outer membrane lipoprotein LolB